MILNMNGEGKDKNLLPENIVEGVEIDGVVGTAPKFEIVEEVITVTATDDTDDDIQIVKLYVQTNNTSTTTSVLKDFSTTSMMGYEVYSSNCTALAKLSPYYSFAGIEVISVKHVNVDNSSYTLINPENIDKDWKDYFYGYSWEMVVEDSGGKGTSAVTRYFKEIAWRPYICSAYSIKTLVDVYGMPAYQQSNGDVMISFEITYKGKFIKHW